MMNNPLPIPNQTTATTTEDAPASWWRRFGFRFFTIYLILFIFPFPLGATFFPFELSWTTKPWGRLWQVIVPWVGQHVLGRTDAYSNPSFTEVDSDS